MRGLKHYMEPYTLVCTLASSQESEFHKLRFHDDQNIMARTITVDVKKIIMRRWLGYQVMF